MQAQCSPFIGSSASPDSITCPACHGAFSHPWGCKNKLALSSCAICGTIFAVDQADGEETKTLYDHYYDRAQFEMSPIVAASLDRLVVSLEGYRQTGRWLDIGFGEGGVLTTAQRRGWACFGTEISPPVLEYGQRRGWTVASDPDADARFPVHGFDVVSMVEILEHVPGPDAVLQTVARMLRPGGIFYMTTPNARSINRRVLGIDWSVVSPPEHLIIWSARGVRQALARNGLTTLRVRTEGLNPSEMLRRLRPKSTAPTMSRNATGFKLNETFSSSPLRRGIKAGINRCLSLFGIGDRLKVWAMRAPLGRDGSIP